MLKMWWKSRTIWAGLFAIASGLATVANMLPEEFEQGLALAGIFNGMLVIYFRKTTTGGIGSVLADNRISGTRRP